MVSQIDYLPLVDAPTTEYSTLMEVLMKIISIIDLLEVQHCVLVFDKAVYTKIQQIRWKEQIFMINLLSALVNSIRQCVISLQFLEYFKEGV